MRKEEYIEIMDELYSANVMLEMCRGYAISESACTSKLGDALYEVSAKYESIYARLKVPVNDIFSPLLGNDRAVKH